MAHMQLASTLPPMPALAGKLQLALGPRLDKFMSSPLAADVVMLTPGAHGMEKADPQAIEKNADLCEGLFKLLKGKFPKTSDMVAALRTLDLHLDGRLTARFPGASAGAFFHYEVEKIRALHQNAARLCRRSKHSRDLPRVNALRKVFVEHVGIPESDSPTSTDPGEDCHLHCVPWDQQIALAQPPAPEARLSWHNVPPAPEALSASAVVQTPLKANVKSRKKKGKSDAKPKAKAEPKKKILKPKPAKTPSGKSSSKSHTDDFNATFRFQSHNMFQRNGWIAQVRDHQEHRVVCQVTECKCLHDAELCKEFGQFLAALLNRKIPEQDVLTVRAAMLAGQTHSIEDVEFSLEMLRHGMQRESVIDLEATATASDAGSSNDSILNMPIRRAAPTPMLLDLN